MADEEKISVITEVANYGANVSPLSDEDEKKYKEDQKKQKDKK